MGGRSHHPIWRGSQVVRAIQHPQHLVHGSRAAQYRKPAMLSRLFGLGSPGSRSNVAGDKDPGWALAFVLPASRAHWAGLWPVDAQAAQVMAGVALGRTARLTAGVSVHLAAGATQATDSPCRGTCGLGLHSTRARQN